jgi:ABC-type uncharacterized transport system substrate-binding protein
MRNAGSSNHLGVTMPPRTGRQAQVRAHAVAARPSPIKISTSFSNTSRYDHFTAWRSDASDIFRRSASYVDRILKGANPAELPAQAPAKFEFAINLKTATTLGLTVPPTVIALADEVIE